MCEVFSDHVTELVVNSESSKLLDGAEGKITIWKLENGENKYRKNQVLGGHKECISCLDYYHKHRLLFSGDEDGLIIIWTN